MELISEDIIASELDMLSQTEFQVYHVLSNRSARTTDVAKIARLCSVTELQVIMAVQLLIQKGVLPTDEVMQ